MLVILHHWNPMSLQVALLQLFDVVSELHRIQTPNMTSIYSISISSCVSGNGKSNSTSLSYEPSATPAYKPNTAPPNASQVSFASFNQSTSVSVIKPAFSSPSIPTTHPTHPPTPSTRPTSPHTPSTHSPTHSAHPLTPSTHPPTPPTHPTHPTHSPTPPTLPPSPSPPIITDYYFYGNHTPFIQTSSRHPTMGHFPNEKLLFSELIRYTHSSPSQRCSRRDGPFPPRLPWLELLNYFSVNKKSLNVSCGPDRVFSHCQPYYLFSINMKQKRCSPYRLSPCSFFFAVSHS